MVFAVAAIANASVVRERTNALMARQHILGDFLEADAADYRRGAGEAPVDDFGTEPDRLKDLRAGVRLERRDPHLGEDLEQPLLGGTAVLVGR